MHGLWFKQFIARFQVANNMAVIIKDNVVYSTQEAPKTDGNVERPFVHLMFDFIR